MTARTLEPTRDLVQHLTPNLQPEPPVSIHRWIPILIQQNREGILPQARREGAHAGRQRVFVTL